VEEEGKFIIGEPMFASRDEDFQFLSATRCPEWISIEAFRVLDDSLHLWLGNKLRQGEYVPDSLVKDYAGSYALIFGRKSPRAIWDIAGDIIDGSVIDSHVWFALALGRAIRHPRDRSITRNQAVKWKEDLIKALERAAELAYNTPENHYDWIPSSQRSLAEIISPGLVNIDEKVPEDIKLIIKAYTPRPDQLLLQLKNDLESSRYDKGFYSSKVNGESALRVHFVRGLTCALLQQTGRPWRRLVAECASVVFCVDIAEREVIRLCKGLDPSEHHRIVSVDEIERFTDKEWWDKMDRDF